MNKFKVGDVVRVVNKSSFYNQLEGDIIEAGEYEDIYCLFQPQIWFAEDELELVAPVASIPPSLIGSAATSKIDGSNGSYYDNKVPDWLVDQWLVHIGEDASAKVILKAEHVIEFVFNDNFDFGNCYKALVRGIKSLEGCGKSGNTLEYEMDKVIYYANKVKEKAQRNAAIDE